MKSPAFQFYPSDYMASQRVKMMSLEEEGAYCNLLWSCWQHGSIPEDPELAARLIGKGCSTTVARVVQHSVSVSSQSLLTSKDNGSVAVATPSSVGITTTPKKETTPIQKIILAFKQLQGVSLEDKAWDHTYFSRFAKPAKDLLGYFDGDWKAAVDCEQSVGEKMQRLGRTWTIETVIKFAHEYKAELLKNGRN